MTNDAANPSDLGKQALPILQVIGFMGAATRTQIQAYLAHPRLLATLTGGSNTRWSKRQSRTWIERVLENELVGVLPSPGRYYSGQTAGRQRILELTPKGRDLLKATGIIVPKMTFTEPTAILHALAVLDVRIALLSCPDTETVVTNRQLGDVRPDNLAKWSEVNKRWVLFESELEAERGSQPRIQKKLERLARFYLSGDADRCERAVRIIYLWKPMSDADVEAAPSKNPHRHESAINTWMNACYSVRVRMPGRVLPFHLYFISHRDFLANPEAPLQAYEYLPATGADPATLSPDENSPDQNSGEMVLDGADDEALAWIIGFDREVRRGIDTLPQQNNLLRMYTCFLDNHPKLRIAFQRLIGAYTIANGADAPRRLEQIGAELLRNLGFPTLPPGIDKSANKVFPIYPVGIAAPGEAPELTFVLTQSRLDLIRAACPQGIEPAKLPEIVSQALSLFVKYAIQEKIALDLAGGDRLTSRRQNKKNKG